jgi:four helix bundle protein
MSLAIHKLTTSFPASERFGLTNHLRRASVSVASNIAEGYGRSTKGEYVLFLSHARGSNCEVQTQLVIAVALGFGAEQDRQKVEGLTEEVSRMVVAMMNKLRK